MNFLNFYVFQLVTKIVPIFMTKSLALNIVKFKRSTLDYSFSTWNISFQIEWNLNLQQEYF